MKIYKEFFFKEYRKEFGNLTQKQVVGMESVIDFWNKNDSLVDLRWLSYIFATIHHETGARWEAIREGFAKDNETAIRIITNMFNRGRIKTNYALPLKNGNSYYGRGFDQMTGADNYLKQQNKTKDRIKYYDEPDLALDLDNNAERVTLAMVDGDYTGRKLSQYFNNNNSKWDTARAIINGKDKMFLIGSYAKQFYKCFTHEKVRLNLAEWLALKKEKLSPAKAIDGVNRSWGGEPAKKAEIIND